MTTATFTATDSEIAALKEMVFAEFLLGGANITHLCNEYRKASEAINPKAKESPGVRQNVLPSTSSVTRPLDHGNDRWDPAKIRANELLDEIRSMLP